MVMTKPNTEPFWRAAQVAASVHSAPGRTAEPEWISLERSLVDCQRVAMLAAQGENASTALTDLGLDPIDIKTITDAVASAADLADPHEDERVMLLCGSAPGGGCGPIFVFWFIAVGVFLLVAGCGGDKKKGGICKCPVYCIHTFGDTDSDVQNSIFDQDSCGEDGFCPQQPCDEKAVALRTNLNSQMEDENAKFVGEPGSGMVEVTIQGGKGKSVVHVKQLGKWACFAREVFCG
jgi:hypothetical protein